MFEVSEPYKPWPVEFLRPIEVGASGQVQGVGCHLAGQESRPITVEAISIDSYCSEREKVWPCAIKIDTDGSEKQILHGAVETIERTQPVILTEWGHVENITAHEVELWQFVTDLRYEIFAFTRSKERYSPPTFCQLTLDQLSASHYKMLFLVPHGRRDDFAALIGYQG